jgi:hypothetical protein
MFSGQVAFISGGWSNLVSVEMYSPLGDCQHVLAPLPIDILRHFSFLFEDTILACEGNP